MRWLDRSRDARPAVIATDDKVGTAPRSPILYDDVLVVQHLKNPPRRQAMLRHLFLIIVIEEEARDS